MIYLTPVTAQPNLSTLGRSSNSTPGETITGSIVAGALSPKVQNLLNSAINPAWRKAVTHMYFGRYWAPNATLTQQQAVICNMTEVDMPILKVIEGCKMGAYMNEANAYEPDSQNEFWAVIISF
jgi:hypothetical protein